MAAYLPPLPPEPPGEPPAGGPEPLPWERPGYPLLEGLFETGKLVLTRPTEAFARMATTGDLSRPLFYAIVLGWIGIIASQIYSLAFRGAMQSFMPALPSQGDFALSTGWSVAMMVLAPVLVLLGIFLWSAIVHLFLLLVGGAAGGFGATVRVMCYASTVQILNVIPLCGGIVAFFWAIVLEIIGLAIAHRTTQGKTALAVLLPLLLCCTCVALAVVGFGVGVASLIGKLR